MKIINLYHKRLVFEEEDFNFSIDAGEIKTVPSSIGGFLVKNRWIAKVEKTDTVGKAKKANGRPNSSKKRSKKN